MAADDFILRIVPILIVVSNVICDYSIKYEIVESCQLVREQNEYNYYFDTSQLKCEKCQQKKEIQVTSTDGKELKSAKSCFFFCEVNANNPCLITVLQYSYPYFLQFCFVQYQT